MEPTRKFSADLSMEEKVLYVLSLFEKGTAEEIATELMELQEVTTEEGVAALKIEVEEVLKKLAADNKVTATGESGAGSEPIFSERGPGRI